MKKKKLLVALVFIISLITLQATALAVESKEVASGNAGGSMTVQEFSDTQKDNKITLVDDVTITSGNMIVSSKLTIDLANHNLTFSKGLLATNTNLGDLTVTGQGKITATNGYNIVVLVQNDSTVNLNGCTVEATGIQRGLCVQIGCTAIIDGGATIVGENNFAVNIIEGGAKVTLNDGCIKSTGTGKNAIAVCIQDADDQFIMNGGTVEAKHTAISINNIKGNSSSFNSFIMNKGEIKHSESSDGVLIVLADAAAEVNGGTITSKTAGASAVQVGAEGTETSGSPNGHAGKLVMNGGTIEANVDNGVGIYAYAKSENATTVNINSGTIKGTETGISSSGKASVKISEDKGETSISGRYGVTAYDNSNVTITAGTINGTTAGIGTNGSDKGTDTSITVSGGDITGGIAGAYMPAGTLTVSGNTKISGQAGIVVRGGEVNVTGGNIEATGTGEITIGDAKVSGNTYKVPAAAIIVDEAGYPQQKDGQKHVTIGEKANLTATSEDGKTLAASNNGKSIEPTDGGKIAPEKSPFDIQGGTFLVNEKADNKNVDQFLPKDTELDKEDGNGIMLSEGKKYLVEVNGVSYTTITEALAHVENGNIVKLLDNVTSEELDKAPYNINKNITIDLNGKTITSTENEAIFNVGDGTNKVELTIKDSASGGTITTSTPYPTIRVKEGSELVVEGGKIENTNAESETGAIQVAGTDGKVGKVTITDGEVIGANYGIAAFGKSEILVKDGSVTGTNNYGIATNGNAKYQGTKVTVEDGAITGGKAGMYLPSLDGETTVIGGTIKGTNGAGIVVRGGSINISGDPTIKAEGTTEQTYGDNTQQMAPAALVVDKNQSYGDKATANVTGGTFTATESQPAVAYYKDGNVDETDTENNMKVSGGKFTSGTGKDEKVSKYLELNLTTNEEGQVTVADNTVTSVKDANGNAVTITTELKENVVEVVVSGSVATSHSTDSETNTWWAGVGFVAPENADKATYKFDNKGENNLESLETWKDGEGNEHNGLSVWFDATAKKEFNVTITWKDDSSTIGEITYHVIVSDNIKIEPFNAEIVGFGYNKKGSEARKEALANRKENDIPTDQSWENVHDWGDTEKDHVMWINFKNPIPNGVTVKVDITTPNGTVETVECKGNGEYHTYAWSYSNKSQTGDIDIQLGEYELTGAKVEKEEGYEGGEVTVSGLNKTATVDAASDVKVKVVSYGFEEKAEDTKTKINEEWKKVKADAAEVTDVDPNTMWVIFQFDSTQPKTQYTVKVLKDEKLLTTETGSDMTNGLLIYESLGHQLNEANPKSGVYIFEFVNNDGIALASKTIELYEVKYVIPEGLFDGVDTNLGTDTFTTTPNSVQAPEIANVPSGKHIEWSKVKNEYELTYTAKLVADQTSKPSSSGSSGYVKTTVKVEKSKNGSVKLSDSSAKAGESVTVTPKPSAGYSVDEVIVTDSNGKEIKVKANKDGTYTFVMPEKSGQPVKVNVTFKAETQEHKCISEKYEDINQNYWYHEAIDYVVEKGLMNGTSETTFSPNNTITRAMVVTILWRLEGEPDISSSATFKDALNNTWYTKAINWAAKNKIVEGYSVEEFGPNNPVTREQMAKILYGYAKYTGMDVDGETNLNNFADANQVSEWAVKSVNWAVDEGLMVGSDGKLNPTNTATRAEFATIMMRYCEKIVED